MVTPLSKKIALVAGATRGAGRGIAVELGAAGATVYVTGRTTRTQPSEYERPETIECGSNVLSGADPEAVAEAMRLVLALPAEWRAPVEYETPDVSRIVVRIVLGRLSLRRHQ
jgi:NAD(P)-dependent dehydrogenase (short-subunit alcohol dehydrogenase family)